MEMLAIRDTMIITVVLWKPVDDDYFSTLVTKLSCFFFLLHLTYSRWAPLPSCLWSLRMFPSLPGSRLTSTLLELVNQWLKFTYSRINAFRYGRQNKNPA